MSESLFARRTHPLKARARLRTELARSEAYLAEGQRLSHTGSWAWNVATGDLFWSRETFRISDLDPAETTPSHELYLEMLHPADRRRVAEELDRAIRECTDFESRFRIVQRGGSVRYLHSLGHPVLDGRGRITEFVGVVIDVTVQTMAEEALARSDERYRSIFENSPLPKWVCDPKTMEIVDVNAAAVEHYGYSREEFLRMTLLDIRPPEDEARFRAAVAVAPSPRWGAGVWRHRKKDGTIIEVDVFLHEINLDGRDLRLAILQDVTKGRRLQAELEDSNQMLRALSARLESIREEESTRIAREVHDELGQALTALQIDVQTLLEGASEGEAGAKQIARLDSMADLIDGAISAVQRISKELRPSVLDDLGLPAALESHLDEFVARTGLSGRFRSTIGDTAVEGPRATAAFRIFQEILTNVARHAKATAVDVLLEIKGGDLVLTVSDDGCGIPEAKIHDPTSLGLSGIRERAHFAGGQMAIRGTPGGTTVTLAVPL
jgi:PAS domain S-box-containing protein